MTENFVLHPLGTRILTSQGYNLAVTLSLCQVNSSYIAVSILRDTFNLLLELKEKLNDHQKQQDPFLAVKQITMVIFPLRRFRDVSLLCVVDAFRYILAIVSLKELEHTPRLQLRESLG